MVGMDGRGGLVEIREAGVRKGRVREGKGGQGMEGLGEGLEKGMIR